MIGSKTVIGICLILNKLEFKMIKDFQIISKLGEGAYSSVYKVKRITDG